MGSGAARGLSGFTACDCIQRQSSLFMVFLSARLKVLKRLVFVCSWGLKLRA